MDAHDRFLESLRATFRVEAAEHLQAIGNGLQQLEQAGMPEADRRRCIEAVFRAAHSLKGAARAVNLADVEACCQQMEDRLAGWRRREGAPAAADIDQQQRLLDRVAGLLGDQPAAPPQQPALQQAAPQPSARQQPAPPQPPGAARHAPATAADAGEPWRPERSAGDSVRVPLARLDEQLLDVEDLLIVRLAAEQTPRALSTVLAPLRRWRRDWSALQPQLQSLRRIAAASADDTGDERAAALDALLGYIERSHDLLLGLDHGLHAVRHTAERDSETAGKRIDGLIDRTKRLLLLPFSHIAQPLPKLVRDLARDLDKQASLVVSGDSIELDRRILDELKDPLIHLLRNSLVHGIEPAARRSEAGKPARGRIELSLVRLDVDWVRLTLRDDGAGIDPARVRAAAVAQGLLGADEAQRLDDEASCALVFESQLSTSEQLTTLAGRGLGLAIVREKVEALGGTIGIDNHPGHSVAFQLRLPVTRAPFRGVAVEAAGLVVVIPTVRIERTLRLRDDAVRSLRGRPTVQAGDGRAVPLLRLSEVLELSAAGGPVQAGESLLIVGSGEQRIALAVDAIIDEGERMLKPLALPLRRVRNIAGVTLLPTGKVAPVLQVGDLVRSAARIGVAPAAVATTPGKRVRTVLVAEDSITSRLLLKAVLEAAGYRVRTAADGAEAFVMLRTADFDALVSDVEMPRLDGFALTARVRGDSRLRELPVVLVTALENRSDRERGIDVGADAYIGKGGFDQNALLDALQRLLGP